MSKSRTTEARTEILNILNATDEALSHADIEMKLNGLCNRVTIYRNLNKLVEEGFLHKVINLDGVLMYAKCQQCDEVHVHNHVHFSCEICKTVNCLEEVEPTFKLPKGYKLSEANFTILGVCPYCQ